MNSKARKRTNVVKKTERKRSQALAKTLAGFSQTLGTASIIGGVALVYDHKGTTWEGVGIFCIGVVFFWVCYWAHLEGDF